MSKEGLSENIANGNLRIFMYDYMLNYCYLFKKKLKTLDNI